MNIDKLAVLVNLLGGYDEASELLGVDEDLIEKAIGGTALGSRQESELEIAYGEAKRDGLIDDDRIKRLANDVRDATLRNDLEIQDGMRLAIANGQVNLDELDNYTTLKDLTNNQLGMIIDWLLADPNREAKDFLSLAFSWNMEESEFWKLFREVFYE